LTTGGYQSAWLAYLVTAFVLESTTKLFDETIFDRIYRDDGPVILDGVELNTKVSEWLNSFQKEVNKVTSVIKDCSSQSVYGER
jgi:aminoglycoside N3'-acetyltransferase